MTLNLRVSVEPETDLPAPFCATKVPEGNNLSQTVQRRRLQGKGLLTKGQSEAGMHSEQSNRGEL